MPESTNTASVFFKPVPGGWVYRAPNPWVFGDTPHYFVTDAQKAEIENLSAWNPARTTAALSIIVVAWVMLVAFYMSLVTGHDEPTARDLFLMVPLIILPLLGLLPLVALLKLRRLMPLLRTLPVSAERISFADIRKRQAETISVKSALNACIASVFACASAAFALVVHIATRHTMLDGQGLTWALATIAMGFTALTWYRRLGRLAAESRSDKKV